MVGQELDQAQGRGRGGDAWSWETTNAAEIWKASWGRKLPGELCLGQGPTSLLPTQGTGHWGSFTSGHETSSEGIAKPTGFWGGSSCARWLRLAESFMLKEE